jgi:hypothetical protein
MCGNPLAAMEDFDRARREAVHRELRRPGVR